MDKEKLLAFLHVAEQHSFAKGSEQLFLNQSTVSARIKALERELEVELFEREKGKGVRLSVYGELFLPYARKIITLMEESKQQLKKERQFNIRIGASIYGYHLLPTVLHLLHRHTPGLEVTIVSGYSPEILSMVQEGDVDIGLVNDIIRFENVEHVETAGKRSSFSSSAPTIRSGIPPPSRSILSWTSLCSSLVGRIPITTKALNIPFFMITSVSIRFNLRRLFILIRLSP